MARIARIGAGIGLILLGLILLVLPGPGILTIAGGLALLATEFTWAANILDWMKHKYRRYFTKGGQDPTASRQTEIPSLPGPSEGETGTPPSAALGGETDYEGG